MPATTRIRLYCGPPAIGSIQLALKTLLVTAIVAFLVSGVGVAGSLGQESPASDATESASATQGDSSDAESEAGEVGVVAEGGAADGQTGSLDGRAGALERATGRDLQQASAQDHGEVSVCSNRGDPSAGEKDLGSATDVKVKLFAYHFSAKTFLF